MGRPFDFFGGDKTQHNVFFAALPDASLIAGAGGVAGDARRRLGLSGAYVPPDRLHVSLQAIGGISGSCPPSVIDTAMTAAGTVSIMPFKVAFDRVASFSASRGPRALVLTGNDDSVAGFMRLQQALQRALAKAGLRLPRQPVILNALARRQQATPSPSIMTHERLTLALKPLADGPRYDTLRGAGDTALLSLSSALGTRTGRRRWRPLTERSEILDLVSQLQFAGIDARTTRHAAQTTSRRKRELIEEAFGWAKAIGVAEVNVHGLARVRHCFTYR